MSKKYIIKQIKGELLLNFLVKQNKPTNIIYMEHDYCKTTECSTLVDHYDECFKRISRVQFENKSTDLIVNDNNDDDIDGTTEYLLDESNVDNEDKSNITNIDNDNNEENDNYDDDVNYCNNQNVEMNSTSTEVILFNNNNNNTNTNYYKPILNNNMKFIQNDNIAYTIVELNSLPPHSIQSQNPIEQIEIDNACESISTNLHINNNNNTLITTKINNTHNNKLQKSSSSIISNNNNNDLIINKNLEQLSILLRQNNDNQLIDNFIPNQIVNYETYQEAVNNNNGKTIKKKCFKYCKYEEGRIYITKEEIQTYNKCKKHILLKDFLKLLIWKKFPSINNVCHFNISSVNIAPRTGYTIYAYCKFLSCNNFRIVIRQSSLSLVGTVYKSRLEPLHYKNVPLVEQVRGLKKKLLGKKYENRTDPYWEWTEKYNSNLNNNNNVFSRKKRKKNKCDNEDHQRDKQQQDRVEELIEHTDEEIVYSTEITVS